MERIKTGIKGLDKALNGGFPEENIVLLSGGAGTGKSTLCLQFLVNGAALFGEKGLYISTEQSEQELEKHAEKFGWNLKALQKGHMLKLEYFDISEGEDLLKKIASLITDFKPKRIVIDSLTTLTDAMIICGLDQKDSVSLSQVAGSPIPRTEQIVSKSIFYKLIAELKKQHATALITSELHEQAKMLSADGISEFIVDGVILLHYLEIGIADYRSLVIRKMRYSDHGKDIVPYDITEKGIEIVEGER